jgi:hypothetical protein
MAYKVFSNGDALTGGELNTFLMNQSVIAFASVAARNAAIPAPLEGQLVWLEDSNKYIYFSGSAWLDLIVPASSGNAIINGAFDIWQRGTSFTQAVYTADRWFTFFTGTSVTGTYTRQSFTPNELNVAGFGEEEFYFQAAVASGSDAATQNVLIQRLEDVRQLANQTVTLSFWAKATSGTPKIGANLRQEFGSGGSSGVDVTGQSATLSTSWARYSFTFTIPSISGKTIGANSFTSTNIWFSGGSSVATSSGSVGLQSATFQVWGVQLETGSTATPFRRNANSLQGELAACQRYYYRATAAQAFSYLSLAGYADGTTLSVNGLSVPVTMRVLPTSVDYSGIRVAQGTTNFSVSNLVLSGNSASASLPVVAATTTGLTSNTSYILRADNNAAAFIGISAEL